MDGTGRSERVGGDERRQSRPVRRILVAVGLAVAVLVGLAWWGLAAPVHATVGGRSVSCDAVDDGTAGAASAEVRDACDEAESDRRTTALLVGAGVATVAAAVSTWPSRRLTGEELGPLR